MRRKEAKEFPDITIIKKERSNSPTREDRYSYNEHDHRSFLTIQGVRKRLNSPAAEVNTTFRNLAEDREKGIVSSKQLSAHIEKNSSPPLSPENENSAVKELGC